MKDINITPNGVEKLLTDLDPSKASGPDELKPRILKELAKEISPILILIFQKSLDTGVIPSPLIGAQLMYPPYTRKVPSTTRKSMDFSKAFDKSSHNLLVHKFHQFGIQGNINRWINFSFLQSRTKAVVFEGVTSDYVPVQSSVPQESIGTRT